MELVARRQALSEQVATVKRETGRATRDFGREREVILRGRNTASRLGVSPDLVESLLRQLIQSSLATQEQARVAAQAHGSGKRALVIGVSTDILFPLSQQQEIADGLLATGAEVDFVALDSPQGHDAFLVDIPRFGAALAGFLAKL